MDCSTDKIIRIPALADVHVHFREPGFEYKETIFSGSMAAAAGGYCCVCPMPNLSPAPDSPENLEKELDIIRRDAVIDVIPYATITKGRKGLEITDIARLKPYCAAFSDDGSGVQKDEVMLEAMRLSKENDCIIAAHCEDNTLPGEDPRSEWGQIERDLNLAAKTGCKYHVCHISSRKSLEIIAQAKRSGVDVTCETAPHYLIFSNKDRKDEGRFKMNPPLRDPEDREALIEGLANGDIDMIATDHAPHSKEEKSRGFAQSAMGIIGLETAFPVMYTKFVKKHIISQERLVELMSTNPRSRFNLPQRPDDFAEFEIATPYRIDPETFKSKARSTPFEGMEVYGRCIKTVYKGKTVYEAE